MILHHKKQVLCCIYKKVQGHKVKVDLPTPSWNTAQRRWDGLHNEGSKNSSDLVYGLDEGPAGNIRGFVRKRKFKGQMFAPRKRTPRLLVRFHQLKSLRNSDRTRRSVTQSALGECKRIFQRRCLIDNILEGPTCLVAELARRGNRRNGGRPERTDLK